MRTLGLIGGMSWESTLLYYRAINTGVRERLGGLHSAPLLIESVDFAAIAALQRSGDWEEAGRRLAACAVRLQSAGAEAVMLCTNTMHKVAPAIEAAIDVPFLHIADALGAAMARADVRRPALLGTRFTMEEPFIADRLGTYGMEVLVPEAADCTEVDRIIFDELCLGRTPDGSRARMLATIDRLAARGVDGVIAGCTEIGLLIGPADTALPFFDTALIHAGAAVEFLLSDQALR